MTQAYTDLASRLRNLQEAETELTTMYEKAVDAEDVLAIYNQKMQVSEQIEIIKGQMQYYEEASATSSISLDISAKASVQPVTIAGWEPKGVARNAVQALINFGEGLRQLPDLAGHLHPAHPARHRPANLLLRPLAGAP